MAPTKNKELHLTNLKRTPAVFSVRVQDLTRSQPTQIAEPTTKQPTTTVTTASLSALHTSECLLKTAIANVSSGSTTTEGHILFNEDAQRSFITQSLADELQLQPTG